MLCSIGTLCTTKLHLLNPPSERFVNNILNQYSYLLYVGWHHKWLREETLFRSIWSRLSWDSTKLQNQEGTASTYLAIICTLISLNAPSKMLWARQFIPFLWEGTGSFIKLWPLNPLSSTLLCYFLCTSKENWFTDQDTMSMIFISFFFLSKWFITLKKFDDNFVRLLALSLKTPWQIYGEMICDLNFWICGWNPMTLTFLKNDETSLVELLHVLFYFSGF